MNNPDEFVMVIDGAQADDRKRARALVIRAAAPG
jgi:hypothetical protein